MSARRSSNTTARATKKAQAVQTSGSKVDVVSIPVSPIRAGEMATAIAAKIAEPRVPPNKRAIPAVSGTSTAAATAAGTRSSQTCSPNTCVAAASKGTKGGWSA